jgi:hydrogenase maturation protease
MFSKPKIVVVGIGNPLCGDDGVGWYAVDKLAEDVKSANVEFIKCCELTPELSEKLSDAKFILFVDANRQVEAGIICEELLVPDSSLSSLDSHRLSPKNLLAYSHALYGRFPEAIMMSIGAESFEYGEALSRVVLEGCDKLTVRCKTILNDRLAMLAEKGN